jgi:hypothetical protein
MDARPPTKEGMLTFLDFFEFHVRERPNDTYLGSRKKIYDAAADPTKITGYGEFEWQTYSQVETIAQNLGRGMTKLGLANLSEGDGK